MAALDQLTTLFNYYDFSGFLARYMQNGLVDRLDRIAATYDRRPDGRIYKAFWDMALKVLIGKQIILRAL